MTCDAIATVRVKMSNAIASEAMLGLLKKLYKGISVVYIDENGFSCTVTSSQGATVQIRYNAFDSASVVRAYNPQDAEEVKALIAKASSLIALQAISGKAKIASSRRVKGATILKVKV